MKEIKLTNLTKPRGIVFLDWDGVICHTQTSGSWQIDDIFPKDKACLERFKDFVQDHDLDIVFVSLRRKSHTRQYLVNALGQWSDAFIVDGEDWKISDDLDRGLGVKKYLFDLCISGEYVKYIILDDSNEYSVEQNLVIINPKTGLTNENIRVAILLLNNTQSNVKG